MAAPIHPQGWRFIGIFLAVTLVLFYALGAAGWAGAVLTLWCAWFFRNPERVTPQGAGLIIAPADGVVSLITEAPPPEGLGLGAGARPRISIFMNVFNVHVNRVPASGRIAALEYRAGKFLNATLDKASEDNERQAVRVTTDNGQDIVFVQIAGLIARRIVCDLKEGDRVVAGQRFGLIRFGSRLDVYLEPGMEPLVAVGQPTVAGETVLAEAGPRPGKG